MDQPAQPSGASRPAREPAPAQAPRAAVVMRMRRLRGQADGIVRMIEADRSPAEVIQQFAAFMAAARQASVEYAAAALRDELAQHIAGERDVDEVVARLRLVIERTARLP